MPVQWTISHPKRFVLAVLKDEVRPRSMIDFLAALDAAGARPYGKLVFLERVVTTFSEDSVVVLANLVRQREEDLAEGHQPVSALRSAQAQTSHRRLLLQCQPREGQLQRADEGIVRIPNG
jgi:hypothetical protein